MDLPEIKKVVITNARYWDCMCKDNFIHLKQNGNYCPLCDSYELECPDSRCNEIKGLYKEENDKSIEFRKVPDELC
jgi:Zn finger protein HypA/HybF involved in hydrogenase expression